MKRHFRPLAEIEETTWTENTLEDGLDGNACKQCLYEDVTKQNSDAA